MLFNIKAWNSSADFCVTDTLAIPSVKQPEAGLTERVYQPARARGSDKCVNPHPSPRTTDPSHRG